MPRHVPAQARENPARADGPRRPPERPQHPLLGLQRSAGNQATAALARQLRQRTLARVGEDKLSFVGQEGANQDDITLLRSTIDGLRLEGKDKKDRFEVDVLEKLPSSQGVTDKKVKQQLAQGRQKTVMGPYVDNLSTEEPLDRLLASAPFAEGRLKLGDEHGGGFYPVMNLRGELVAQLSVGGASFLPDLIGAEDEPKSERKTLTKLDKQLHEYVEDDRRVATRRYAYCEKNIFQFMEMVATGKMSGRFQMLQEALGEKPNVRSVTAGLGGLITANSGEQVKPQGLDNEQLAVLHQWMGNGMQQRGVSLTSTPREKAVFSNDGESFREADGVRLKIDLFRVPKDVILINHYSSGGVKDGAETVNSSLIRNVPSGDDRRVKYGFAQSVIKNREVYLERLDPDWIVGIDVHNRPPVNVPITPNVQGSSDLPQKSPEGRDLVAEVGKEMGFPDYNKGFGEAVREITKKDPPPDDKAKADSPYVKGVKSGRMYMHGYAAGKSERTEFQQSISTTKKKITDKKTSLPKNKSTEEIQKSLVGMTSQLMIKTPTAPAHLAANLVCNTLKENGYNAMDAIDPTGWLALTTLAKQDVDKVKKTIYWIGWAHAAGDKPPREEITKDFY